MLIKIIDQSAALESELTPKEAYLNRRRFMEAGLSAGLGVGLASLGVFASDATLAASAAKPGGGSLGVYDTKEDKTPLKDVTHYNNYYEFGTDKTDPAKNAGNFKTKPWTLTCDGEIAKPGSYELGEFLKPYKAEERIYRLRCVEGWSMVIPWLGIPLADILKDLKPTSKAKYVQFTSVLDPQQMPGQKSSVLPWPYVEGLRLDEAMHPLTLLATGLYGEPLPNQNGAPIRLVVPWKYGFKSSKAIVKISLTEKEPVTTWNKMAPKEYGFYANVNPKVDHPRWTQAKERRIGEFFKRETLMFNGYGEHVAALYSGMDLKTFF